MGMGGSNFDGGWGSAELANWLVAGGFRGSASSVV